MAAKRQNEYTDTFTAKILKLSEETGVLEDMILDKSELSPDIQCSLQYDFILKTFVIGMEKDRKDGNRWIGFGEEETGNIIKLSPVMENLTRKYTARRSAKQIDIPFETCRAGIGELVTVMSLKENTFKRGQFDIDIIKCVKKEDGSYIHTLEGVRFSHTVIQNLVEKLCAYQRLMTTVIEKTKEVVTMALAVTIIREIMELADPQKNCDGCQINHPSQKQHMGFRGCLSEDKYEWPELVKQYWCAVKADIQDEEVAKMATGAISHLPELQKYFIPSLITIDDIQECDVKEIIMKKDEMDDHPIFRVLTDKHGE